MQRCFVKSDFARLTDGIRINFPSGDWIGESAEELDPKQPAKSNEISVSNIKGQRLDIILNS